MFTVKFIPRADWATQPYLGPLVFVVDENQVLGAWTGTQYAMLGGGSGTVDAAGVLTAMQAMDGTQETAARAAIQAVDAAGARSAVILAPATVAATGTLTRGSNGNRTNFVTSDGLTLSLNTDSADGANPWQPDDMIVVQGFSALAATVSPLSGAITFLSDAGTATATASAVGRQVVLQHTNNANEWRVLSAAVVAGAAGAPLIVPATSYAAKNGTTQGTIAVITVPGNALGKRGQLRVKGHVAMPGSTDGWEVAAYADIASFVSGTTMAYDSLSNAVHTHAYCNWLVAEGNGTDTASIVRPAHTESPGPGSAIGVAVSATTGVTLATQTTIAVNTANPWTITIRARSLNGATDTLTPINFFAEIINLGD